MDNTRDLLIRMALKLGPPALVLVLFAAVLAGTIFHATRIDELKFREPSSKKFEPNVIIADKPTDLVWFLQVTDLHLSVRGDFDRETDFAEFAKTYVDIFKPDAVLVTGDLTDGRKINTTFGTGPQKEEWVAYSKAIRESGTLDKTAWLDIRGNHDNFNVFRPFDPNILYRQYSIQGKTHARNYMHMLNKHGKNYSFIGVDEVQTPGLKIPFNFIGIVKDEDLSELNEFKETSDKYNSQYHVWFAHYPTSSIASPGEGLRNIIDGPYLCGHYHTIGNLVMKMHSTQQPGFTEVELGDWKYNRRVRLAAIDHQLFSFVDFKFRDFPVALMTNPKQAEHLMPKYEPVGRVFNSTHIRVIAFSNVSIDKVEVSIDDRQTMTLDHVEGPLYVKKWNPSEFESSLHTAKIVVTDSEGKTKSYTQSFSFDNEYEDFTLGAKMLLRIYFKTGVMTIFFFIVTACVLPMVLLRFVTYKHQDTPIKRHYKGTLLYNLHLLSNIDRLFWVLVIIPIWMAIGPHFIGYLVDEAIGACFVWGVLIDGTFVHTGITYNVGSIFLLLVHIPTLIILSSQVGLKQRVTSRESTGETTGPIIMNYRVYIQIAITVLQLLMGKLLFSAYGALAFFTSFPYVWCIAIYAACWYRCTNLTVNDFRRFEMAADVDEQQALTGHPSSRDDK